MKIDPRVIFEIRWPTFATCMARAAHSSGVPFMELFRAAEVARKAFKERRDAEYIESRRFSLADVERWSKRENPNDA